MRSRLSVALREVVLMSRVAGLVLLGGMYLGIARPTPGYFQRLEAEAPSETPRPPSPPYISSPVTGQRLQGVVAIIGSTDVDGLESYTLDFSYGDDQTHTWFVIATGARRLAGDELARWDTRQVTDGDYRLRLRLVLQGSDSKRYIVEDVRVRNYTATDTPTPSLTHVATNTLEPSPTITRRPTATRTAFPTPTPIASNAAELSSAQIRSSAVRGFLAAVLLFASFGLLIRLRRP
jgi:hypothetical protein